MSLELSRVLNLIDLDSSLPNLEMDFEATSFLIRWGVQMSDCPVSWAGRAMGQFARNESSHIGPKGTDFVGWVENWEEANGRKEVTG